MWPHRRQPTRLPCPLDSPGKNTGVGCHFLLQCMKVKSKSEVAQLCLTLSDPMDCSLPGSSVHGIFQAKVLEWVAIAFYIRPISLVETEDPFIWPESHLNNAGVGYKSKIKQITVKAITPLLKSPWGQRLCCSQFCSWHRVGTWIFFKRMGEDDQKVCPNSQRAINCLIESRAV